MWLIFLFTFESWRIRYSLHSLTSMHQNLYHTLWDGLWPRCYVLFLLQDSWYCTAYRVLKAHVTFTIIIWIAPFHSHNYILITQPHYIFLVGSNKCPEFLKMDSNPGSLQVFTCNGLERKEKKKKKVSPNLRVTRTCLCVSVWKRKREEEREKKSTA